MGLSGITVDDELTANDIFDLGTHFRSFDPDSLTTYSVEGTPDTVGEAQILRLVEGPETEAVLSLFRGGAGTELEPEGVRLTVRNGTGAPRQGAESAEALRGVGFNANVAGDEPGGARTARWCATRLGRRRRPTSWPGGWRAAPGSSPSRAAWASSW